MPCASRLSVVTSIQSNLTVCLFSPDLEFAAFDMAIFFWKLIAQWRSRQTQKSINFVNMCICKSCIAISPALSCLCFQRAHCSVIGQQWTRHDNLVLLRAHWSAKCHVTIVDFTFESVQTWPHWTGRDVFVGVPIFEGFYYRYYLSFTHGKCTKHKENNSNCGFCF